MNKLITSLLMLIVAFSLYSCSNEEEVIVPSGKMIRIGFIGPMSGIDKLLGEDSLEGIQTILHMYPLLNNGDRIELLVEDDNNEPGLAVDAFRKLVEKDKVTVIIVASSSAAALAVNNLADQYKTPTVILLASHPQISEDTNFVTQISFDDIFQARVAALFVRDELLLERVAVFRNPESYHSSSLADEFVRQFRSIEGKIIDEISVSSTTVEYEKILSSLRDKDVQLLYLPMEAENVIEISKQLQKIDWAPTAMGGDGLLSRAFAQKSDEVHYLEGFYVTDLYSSDMEMTPLGRKVTRVFRSKFDSRNSTFPAIGVEGMLILRHAINRCSDGSNKNCINARLHTTIDFKALMGNITIQSSGKALRPLIVNRIRGDQLEFVVKVY